MKKLLFRKSNNYKETNLKERHSLVRPLKNACFKLKEVKRLGFSITKKLWRTCHNTLKRNLGCFFGY